MQNNILPKVLVVGQYFSYSKGGGGITLCNLFKDWDKDKLANLPFNLKDTEPGICKYYYRLGDKEISPTLPFLFPKVTVKSIKLTYNQPKKDTKNLFFNSKTNKNKNISFLKKIKREFIHLLGFDNNKYTFKVSKELLDWINEFSPDVIYAQYSTLPTMRFVYDLSLKLNKPLIIHFMDDWISTLNKPSLLYFFWQKKIKEYFFHLLKISKLRLVISELMAKEYENRYRYQFSTFHNPVDLKIWYNFSKENWQIKQEMKLLYTGRIGLATEEALKTIGKKVYNLNKKGYKFIFDIYTTTELNNKSLKSFKGLNIHPAVPYENIPDLMSNYDILVLPLSFNKTAINFARLSIPTKTAEYMISKIPILLFAPPETALYQFAKKERWAYIVDKEDKIEQGILTLYKNHHLRKNLANRAYKIAYENFSSDIVRKKFRNLIINIAKGENSDVQR